MSRSWNIAESRRGERVEPKGERENAGAKMGSISEIERKEADVVE